MSDLLFALATGILFGVGIFQILRRDLIKVAMGFAVLSTAINLFLLVAGAYEGKDAPFTNASQPVNDPLVQALILTAIVVSFGSYTLILAIISIVSRRYKTIDSDEVTNLKH